MAKATIEQVAKAKARAELYNLQSFNVAPVLCTEDRAKAQAKAKADRAKAQAQARAEFEQATEQEKLSLLAYYAIHGMLKRVCSSVGSSFMFELLQGCKKDFRKCSVNVQDLIQDFICGYLSAQAEGQEENNCYKAGFKAVNHDLYSMKRDDFKHVYIAVYSAEEWLLLNVTKGIDDLVYSMDSDSKNAVNPVAVSFLCTLSKELTLTQRKRLVAMAKGKGYKAIAKAEGTTQRAVAKTAEQIRAKAEKLLQEMGLSVDDLK